MLALLPVVHLLLFLASVLWLAATAERDGLVERAAGALARRARGRGTTLYVLTCGLCALLTAALSLDGAIVLAVPTVLALSRDDERLRAPLVLGVVVVANVSSLAVPQGNPTNVVVMERLGIAPAQFLAHVFLPGLLATVVAAALPGLLWRRRLAAVRLPAPAPGAAPGGGFAATALAAAAAAGVAAPWLGAAPWLAPLVVAGGAWVVGRRLGRPLAPVRVPWRLGGRLALLVAVASLLPAVAVRSTSATASVGIALAAAAIAAVMNNLPASVALGGLLGGPGVTAYAALSGLAAGALATRRGSVATMLAFERAGVPPRAGAIIAPAALGATVVAASSVWLLRQW